MLGELYLEPHDVSCTERHGAAPGGAAGRVGEPDEPLTVCPLEQLDEDEKRLPSTR